MNVYLALFTGGPGRPDKYATILAPDFDTASGCTLGLRNKFVPGHTCSTSVLADQKDVNAHATDLVGDLTADQYLGLLTAEARPPRMEVVVELKKSIDPADHAYVRQQLAGYKIISIRELA
jgi:hypothetical protein